MLAEVYDVKVCESALAKAHGHFLLIREIYLPSKKIAFNETNDFFYCFVPDKQRYTGEESTATKLGEIDIPKAMVQAMNEYIVVSKRLGKTKKWFKRCVLPFDERHVNYKSRKSRKKKA